MLHARWDRDRCIRGGSGERGDYDYEHEHCHESCHHSQDRQYGQYGAKDLTAGKYDVTAVANGFKTTIVKGVEINEGKALAGGYPSRNWQLGRMLRICRGSNESGGRLRPESEAFHL